MSQEKVPVLLVVQSAAARAPGEEVIDGASEGVPMDGVVNRKQVKFFRGQSIDWFYYLMLGNVN